MRISELTTRTNRKLVVPRTPTPTFPLNLASRVADELTAIHFAIRASTPEDDIVRSSQSIPFIYFSVRYQVFSSSLRDLCRDSFKVMLFFFFIPLWINSRIVKKGLKSFLATSNDRFLLLRCDKFDVSDILVNTFLTNPISNVE